MRTTVIFLLSTSLSMLIGNMQIDLDVPYLQIIFIIDVMVWEPKGAQHPKGRQFASPRGFAL